MESAVDSSLLRLRTEEAVGRLTPSKNVNDANNGTIPMVMNVKEATAAISSFSLTPLGGQIVSSSSQPAVTLGSPLIVSALPPSQLPQAHVWKAAVNGNALHAGGVKMSDASVLTVNGDGHLTAIPLGSTKESENGKVEGFVAKAPLKTPLATLPTRSNQLPTEKSMVTAAREITTAASPSNIPKGFVLSGTVQLFGQFEEKM